jgi:hypothetical protein
VEVYEALARDGYIAAHFLPFITVAVLLDGTALLVLLWSVVAGRPWPLTVVVGVTWIASIGMHTLVWLISILLFAA